MNKDTKHSTDSLQDAIRAVSGESVTARKAASVQPAAVSPGADLRSVLNELAGSDGKASRNTNAASPSDPNAMRDALHGQWGGEASTRPSSSSSRSASSQPPVGDGINDLIREVTSDSGRSVAPNATKTTQAQGAQIGDAVQDAHKTVPSAGPDTGISATLRRFGLAVLTIVLLAGGAALWWSQTQHSVPVGTLQSLAQAVEQYRTSHNGELPKELAAIETFPKDAVEWPLRYWKARDAAGRTEVIWIPQNGHYRIVLRQSNEVWTVSDREGKPKRIIIKENP